MEPLTDPQKKKIEQRALQLMEQSGMEAGPAAQQAFAEIVGTLADVPAEPTPREQQVARTGAELPVINLDLEDEEAKYVRRRSAALEAVHYSPDEAEAIARKEFKEQFKEPAPPGFGGLEKRKKEKIEGLPGGVLAPEAAAPISLPAEATGQEAGLGAVLRPQTFLPESQVEAETERLQRTAKATTSGVGVDWYKLQKLFQRNLNISEQEAAEEVAAFRIAYEAKLVEVEKQGVKGLAASEQALEDTLREIQDIGVRMQDKDSYIKDVPEDQSQDPWIRTFEKQVTVGEGIPDLTPVQRQYLNAQYERQRAKGEKELSDKAPTKKVMVTRGGEEIEAIDYDPEIHGPVTVKEVPLTEEEIKAQVDKGLDKPWWLDEQKRQQAVIDPEAVGESGIFTDTSALGTTRETTTGWLLRTAMAPLNAVAGAASAALLRGGDLPEARKRKRAEKAPAFEEHPILLNIAENRGFVGEFEEAANIVGAEGVPYYIIVGGGFAADMLDPSLDVLRGFGVGARTGLQVAKARKALNLVPEGALAAGLKAGANAFIDSSVLSSLVKPRFEIGDVRNILTNQVDDMVQSADAVRRETGKLPDITTSPGQRKLIEEAMEVSEGLDDIASGLAGKAVRKKELARQLGALARVDEEALKVMREVDRTAAQSARLSARTPKINQYVQALRLFAPDSYEILRKGLLRDVVSRNVYAATKDINAFDNLVALTKNTWAGKNDAAAIMKRAGDSEVGQLAKELSETDVSFKVVRPTKTATSGLDKPARAVVAPVYKLSDAQAETLSRIVGELQTFRKLDQVSVDILLDQIDRGFISTKNLRRVLDANIDMIAEGMAGAGKEVARARDVARLDVGVQRDLLVPLENRAFSRQYMKQVFNKIRSKITSKSPNLSVGQQQLLKEAHQRASSLDVNLRNGMKRIMQDADYREALTGSRDPLTREEALAYLIAGPKQSQLPKGDIPYRPRDQQAIKEILDFMNSQLFYTKNTREDIFDLFSGVNFRRETSLLTKEGQAKMDAVMLEEAAKVAQDPSQLWAASKRVNDEMRSIVTGGDPTYIRDTEGIIDVVARNDGKIPQEVQIGTFYKSEADRIITEMLDDLVNTEIGKANLNLMDAFDEPFQKVIRDATTSMGLTTSEGLPVDIKDINQIAPDIIGRRLIRQILVPNWNQIPTYPGDIINAFGAFLTDDGKRDALRRLEQMMQRRQSYEVFVAFDALFEHADDIAAGILRRNELKSPSHLNRMLQDIGDTFKGDTYKQLEVVFGQGVARQLKNEFSKGSEQLRSELRDFVHRRYEDHSGVMKTKHFLEDVLHAIEKLRYNLLLAARPRFHGTNMMTAMDIVYNTTGRLPAHPLQYMLELPAFYKGSTPGRVIATDQAGRSYTAGELRDLLTETGGRTVYDLQTPSARTSKILNELDEGTVSGAKRMVDAFQELPQMEDMMVRYMVLRTALDEGRSLDEAVALARKALFDIGDVTKVEKQIQRLMLFYGFTRNNFVNMLKNLAAGPQGWKRIAATAKVKRGGEALAPIDEQERRYAPSYAQTRMLLGTRLFGGGKDITIAGPMIPTLDAVNLFGEMLKLQMFDVAAGMLHPSYKKAFGVQSPFDKEIKQIPPEHVAMMKATGANPADMIEVIAGGTVVPRFGRPEDGAVGGLIYPLDTPSQRSRYKAFVDSMNWIGMSAPTTDWARTLFPEGTAGTGRGLGEAVAYAVGAATPLKTLSPEEQAYYDSLDRLKAAREFNKQMQKISVKESQLEETKEERKERKELGEKRRAKPRAIAEVPDTKKRKLEIKAEIGQIQFLLKSGQISKADAKRRLNALKKEIADLNRIEREKAKR